MKTNLLKYLFLIFAFSPMAGANDVACLRGLLPFTDKVSTRAKRNGIEKPFVLSDKYVVFPEVSGDQLTGFYVYSDKKVAYYDSAQAPGKKKSKVTWLRDLPEGKKAVVIYDLVAQPEGLETITLSYAPSYRGRSSHASADSSSALGASVLPVVGALTALQEKPIPQVYWNPKDASETELRGGRQPSSVQPLKVEHRLLAMSTQKAKAAQELRKPLLEELALRKAWIQKSNLDDQSFKGVNQVLQESCQLSNN